MVVSTTGVGTGTGTGTGREFYNACERIEQLRCRKSLNMKLGHKWKSGFQKFFQLVSLSDIPVTETQTDTETIDISKTHTETNTEKIFNTDTIYI